MCIYFFRGYATIKQLSNQPDILSYLLGKEAFRYLLALLQLLFLTSGELDDASIVEVADLLKTSLEDISPDISIDFGKGIQLPQDRLTDGRHIQLVVGLIE
jgi:hypothetical protein